MSDKTYCLKHYRQTFPNKGCDMCEQAAEIKTMSQRLDDMTFWRQELRDTVEEQAAEIARLKVEIKALKDALTEIAKPAGMIGYHGRAQQRIANAALEVDR